MRRSPGRPPVPLERIVAAALRIVDEEGAEALSMRTLAQRLGSGTATLYRHFDNRAALVAHVVDRVFGTVELDGGEGDGGDTGDEGGKGGKGDKGSQGDGVAGADWRQACRTTARAMFDALARHRNVAPLLFERIPLGPHAMAVRESCVAALLAAGFPPRTAAHAYATLSRYVLGFAVQFRGPGDPARAEEAEASAVFREADPARYPATVAVAAWLPVPLEEEFAFGLELVLDGLGRLRDDG
ncbi:TetR/AcrR family transcriptional regulator [Streptomyces sp. NPDC093085]|uniref:TetR/AcrR family transcriptional regulator n=1 Tax=Streptomyces sp. NPDC093085 TaxID=3155068 RepID=UPI0034367031